MADPVPPSSFKQRCTQGLLCLIVADIVMLAADGLVGVAGSTAMTAPIRLGTVRLALHSSALVVIDGVAGELAISLLMVAVMALHIACAVILGHWRGEPETAVITAVAVAVGSGVLIPWGVRFQALLVAALVAILAIGEYLIEGEAYPAVLAVLGLGTMATTIYLSRELHATRLQLAARASEDADTRRRADELNERLETTILERTAGLEAAAEEFEQLCQAASHDLRPPLRTIAGFGEILRESALEQKRASQVRELDQVIDLAQAMGTRIDDLLRVVRSMHRSISESLLSLSDVARSERAKIAPLNPSCRWMIEDGLVAGPSSYALADLLRALLRYFASTGDGSAVREIGFGCRDVDGERCYFVRATGHRTDTEQRRTISRSLAGAIPFVQVPDELTEVVAAARSLVTAHGGMASLDCADASDVTFWFRGPAKNVTEVLH